MLIRDLNTFGEGVSHRNISITEASQVVANAASRALNKIDVRGSEEMSYAPDRVMVSHYSYGDRLPPLMVSWFFRLEATLRKGRRKDVRMLDDGSADLVLHFAGGLGDVLAYLTEIDALKAMIRVDLDYPR